MPQRIRCRLEFARFLADRTDGLKRPSAGTFKRDMAGNCEQPLVVSTKGAKPLNYRTRAMTTGDIKSTEISEVITLETSVRCRQCPSCSKAKAWFWRMRAINEIGAANRTWFATYTFSPVWQVRLRYSAGLRLARSGIDLDALPLDEQHREISGFAIKEFQKYAKRLRKSGANIRYLLVVEAHKSGLPHLHALVHEPSDPVRHAVLGQQWTCGFSNIKLVAQDEKQKAAAYVTKYLTKSLQTRMRGSVGYGLCTPDGLYSIGLPSMMPKPMADHF